MLQRTRCRVIGENRDQSSAIVHDIKTFATHLDAKVEVRGLGIVAVPCAPKTRVALAVSLDGTRSRLPPREDYKAPWDLSQPLPLLRIAAFDPSAPAKILLAAAAFERNLFRESVGARST